LDDSNESYTVCPDLLKALMNCLTFLTMILLAILLANLLINPLNYLLSLLATLLVNYCLPCKDYYALIMYFLNKAFLIFLTNFLTYFRPMFNANLLKDLNFLFKALFNLFGPLAPLADGRSGTELELEILAELELI